MRILDLAELQGTLVYRDVIDRMRDALLAQWRGECDTPMPMHLDIAPVAGEVHIKSSYRRGGKYFALKIAGTFPGNLERGLSTGSGMMLLCSAATGQPLALLLDEGHLTDVRTAAAAAMVTRELGRTDQAIGILGSGIQARLQARMHAEVLDLRQVWLWGRTPARVESCRSDLRKLLPGVEVSIAASPAEVTSRVKLIVTATAARAPLLLEGDIQPGSHITAVGADSPGKQELDPRILREASPLLVDSVAQCEKLGELQHAPERKSSAVEIGEWCGGKRVTPGRHSICDLTGLGMEDLYIAEYCYENRKI
jgi:ornithine cyclodeaminase